MLDDIVKKFVSLRSLNHTISDIRFQESPFARYIFFNTNLLKENFFFDEKQDRVLFVKQHVSNIEFHFFLSLEYNTSLLDFSSKKNLIWYDYFSFIQKVNTKERFSLPNSFRVLPVEYLDLYLRLFFRKKSTTKTFSLKNTKIFDKWYSYIECLKEEIKRSSDLRFLRVLNETQDQQFINVNRLKIFSEFKQVDEEEEFNFWFSKKEVKTVFGYFSHKILLYQRLQTVMNINTPLMLNSSPWPILISFLVSFFLISSVLSSNFYDNLDFYLFFLIFLIILVTLVWTRDVTREYQFGNQFSSGLIFFIHSNIKFGFYLFILSELLFFVGFFWSFFSMFWSPTYAYGYLCPPSELEPITWKYLSVTNTVLLISSSFTITWAMFSQRLGNFEEYLISMGLTFYLSVIFLYFQFSEYLNSSFGFSDGIWGSNFFILTGFHGLHVLIGAVFIFACFIRALIFKQFTTTRKLGFQCAINYWHFVDVVWVFLYLSVYFIPTAFDDIFNTMNPVVHFDDFSKSLRWFPDWMFAFILPWDAVDFVDLHNLSMKFTLTSVHKRYFLPSYELVQQLLEIPSVK